MITMVRNNTEREAMGYAERKLFYISAELGHNLEDHLGLGGYGAYYYCSECNSMFFIAPNGSISMRVGGIWGRFGRIIHCKETVIREIIE